MTTNEKIIKQFLTEMVTQDNRSTAFPFYYTIRTKKKVYVGEDEGEKNVYYDSENCTEYDSVDEFKEELIEHGYDKERISERVRALSRSGIRWEWEHRGMFLTESDAKNHLRSNKHHYSPDADTYVEHAWRAPGLTNFFKALLEHFDIRKEGQ